MGRISRFDLKKNDTLDIKLCAEGVNYEDIFELFTNSSIDIYILLTTFNYQKVKLNLIFYIMEFKIHVSSKSSRTIDPNNSPSNFKTIFNKPIILDQKKKYLIGLDNITTMTYCWYNIGEQYKNNKIRFGVLSPKKDVINTFDITYNPIEFSPGSYTYDNINEYLEDILILNNKEKDAIKLDFDLAKFKCKLTIKSGYILDLKKSTFCNIIGFEEKVFGFPNKLEDSIYWGTKSPNITNSIDAIYIHCD